MHPVPKHPLEEKRLAELKRFRLVLDSPENKFSEVVSIAATLFDSPISAVTVINETQQIFKCIQGVDAQGSSREDAFCAHTILQTGVMVVEDATLDNRFSHSVFVTQEPHVRFYAGAPLITSDGYPLGALCVLGSEPKKVSDNQTAALLNLAKQIVRVMETKLATEAAALEATRLRMLALNMTSGIVAVNADRKISFINPAFCSMFDITVPTELIVGRPASDLVAAVRKHQVDPELAGARLQEIIAMQKPVLNEELRFIGGRRLERDYIPLLNDDTYAGHLWIYRDVTTQKEQEQTLATALEKAEIATKVKSDFLANMSHEIRTPLNGIIGITGLIQDSELSAEQRAYANNIKECGESLLEIVNDILDYSKIEAQKLDFDNQPFSIQTCLEQSIYILSHRASLKGLELRTEISAELPPLFIGDSGRLRQIFLNLIGNSVKFTHEGFVSTKVSVEPLANEECLITFAIRDTGIGIPEDRIGVLFKSFNQVDTSTSRKYGGTGLGLAISKSLAEMMGGQIGVESEFGKGTTFTFSIKLKKATASLSIAKSHRHLPAATTEKNMAGNQVEISSLRILVADDNSINIVLALGLLKKLGYQADVATNGAEVLVATSQKQYDLILMDVQMPEVSGLEATERIRVKSHSWQPTIIALTANAMKSDQDKCFAAGMDDYLSKPIRPEILSQKINKWFPLQAAKATPTKVS